VAKSLTSMSKLAVRFAAFAFLNNALCTRAHTR
jgi:hypothetical protein